MTLANVVSRVRTRYSADSSERAQGARDALSSIRSDPDFTLRERIEAMISDLELPYDPGFDHPTGKGIARRLRELLEGK